MALRYFVCRHYIKWKGKMYKKGELLPENFTHHDKARNCFSSRIGQCEVPDGVPETSANAEVSGNVNHSIPAASAPPISGQPPKVPQTGDSSVKGTTPAGVKPVFNFKPATTGTPQ